MPITSPLYPAELVLAGRRTVVIGAGRVAARKVAEFLVCGAEVVVIAPEVDPEVRARARAGEIVLEERPYRDGDLDGAWLALVATGDREVNRAVRREADRRRVWLNSADDPENCSFTLPARLRRGPLLITVSTGGRSPAVAAWLRRRLEEEIGPEYETLIELVAAERSRLQANGCSTETLDWQRALDSGTLDLVREGRLAEAKERLQACLSSSSD
ncbi:MAG: bifunctional precorrin-2 dehydrogenase/sirohydrochlorin ferrochelatase [Acidimicrobiales bacterium]|nr:bifunctional precorrin-2 dehydrogenase/sirohydrochlorin ferrochelatase [Acidimicrobiales bacterium]